MKSLWPRQTYLFYVTKTKSHMEKLIFIWTLNCGWEQFLLAWMKMWSPPFSSSCLSSLYCLDSQSISIAIPLKYLVMATALRKAGVTACCQSGGVFWVASLSLRADQAPSLPPSVTHHSGLSGWFLIALSSIERPISNGIRVSVQGSTVIRIMPHLS